MGNYFILGVCLAIAIAGAVGVYAYLIPGEKEILVSIDWDAQPGWTVSDPPVTSLTVEVSGPRRPLARLAGISYSPKLKIIEEGVVSLPVEFAKGVMPKGIKVLSVTPATLNFKVAKQISKEVFVILETAGQPARGYTITEMSAAPQRVILRGAASELSAMETVQTVPLDVSRARENVTAEIPLALSEAVARASENRTVTVLVVIDEEKAVRRITVPVQGKNPPKYYTITPPDIELFVKGPIQALDDLPKSGEMASWVDLKGMAPGVHARRATIALPLSVTLQDASPEVFTVHIR